jgi:hypothetical protein
LSPTCDFLVASLLWHARVVPTMSVCGSTYLSKTTSNYTDKPPPASGALATGVTLLTPDVALVAPVRLSKKAPAPCRPRWAGAKHPRGLEARSNPCAQTSAQGFFCGNSVGMRASLLFGRLDTRLIQLTAYPGRNSLTRRALHRHSARIVPALVPHGRGGFVWGPGFRL